MKNFGPVPKRPARHYSITGKTVNIVKNHCSKEYIQHKHQLAVVHAACIPINWPKDSQKLDLYMNEEGMIELLVGSQQPLAKEFA